MTTLEELNQLRSEYQRDDISDERAMELQWQINFLEELYSRELEDFDYA